MTNLNETDLWHITIALEDRLEWCARTSQPAAEISEIKASMQKISNLIEKDNKVWNAS